MTKLSLKELARIQERLNALFERALLPVGYRDGEEDSPGTWMPAVDVLETREAYLLYVELPGVQRQDVEIRHEGNSLEISGRSKPIENGRQFLRMERSYGPFRRVFELGSEVDAEGISAELEHGLLTVTVPKRSPGSHRVEVTVEPERGGGA